MNRTFQALTTTVSVEIDDDVVHRDVALALIAPYPSATGASTLAYHLRADSLTRDGAPPLPADDPSDVVPLFEIDFYQQLIARAAPGWLLHAAAIEVDGRALVVAGPSGAGKTTMALALVARGHRLLTEEIVWINGDGNVRGLPRAMHIRDREQVPVSWTALDYPMRASARTREEHIVVVPPAETFAQGPLPLHALVRLTHGPDRVGGLELLAAHDALARFWDSTLRQDDPGLVTATTVVRSRPAYRLASTSFGAALQAIGALLGEPNS